MPRDSKGTRGNSAILAATSSTTKGPPVSKETHQKSHIDTLPDDILRTIFSLFGSEPSNDRSAPFQYILATVSRRWRNLVTNTPLLWTTILIPSSTSFDTFKYFERSQPALVDVSFDSVSTWIPSDSEVFSRASEAIANHISRVRSLKIYVGEPKEIYTVLQSWKDLEAPNLQSLVLSVANGIFNPPGIFPFSVFSSPSFTKFPIGQRGKHLISLKLDGISFQDFAPLPNLTSLELDRLNSTPKDFQDILTSFPLLDKLVVRQFEGSPHTPQPSELVSEVDGSSLRCLAIKIDGGHDEDCSCVLPFLSTKNLEYLEFVHFGPPFHEHYISITRQWKKLPHLKKFVIRSTSIWASDISFLSDLPRTTNLEIIDFPRDAEAALFTILTLSNLASVTFDLSRGRWGSLDATLFSDIFAREHIELRYPTAILLSSKTEMDPEWGELQATLGDKFSVSEAESVNGLLYDVVEGVEHSLMLDNGETSPWMSDEGSDLASDEFGEYDEFELYDRDEIEYLHEDGIYDDDDGDDPFQYDPFGS